MEVHRETPYNCARAQERGRDDQEEELLPEFKAKIVRELVEGDDSVVVVAAWHHLSANIISDWRKQLEFEFPPLLLTG